MALYWASVFLVVISERGSYFLFVSQDSKVSVFLEMSLITSHPLELYNCMYTKHNGGHKEL